MAKNRSVQLVHEDFGAFFNEVSASAAVVLFAFGAFGQPFFQIMNAGAAAYESGVL